MSEESSSSVSSATMDQQQQQQIINKMSKHEEVDMNDLMMDPLEWSVRKVLPIPKFYYWEEISTNENSTNSTTSVLDDDDDRQIIINNINDISTNIPLSIKLWHQSVFYMGKVLHTAELAGEMLANLVGLNRNQFSHVMDSMSEEDWDMARQVHEEKYLKDAQDRMNVEQIDGAL